MRCPSPCSRSLTAAGRTEGGDVRPLPDAGGLHLDIIQAARLYQAVLCGLGAWSALASRFRHIFPQHLCRSPRMSSLRPRRPRRCRASAAPAAKENSSHAKAAIGCAQVFCGLMDSQAGGHVFIACDHRAEIQQNLGDYLSSPAEKASCDHGQGSRMHNSQPISQQATSAFAHYFLQHC